MSKPLRGLPRKDKTSAEHAIAKQTAVDHKKQTVANLDDILDSIPQKSANFAGVEKEIYDIVCQPIGEIPENFGCFDKVISYLGININFHLKGNEFDAPKSGTIDLTDSNDNMVMFNGKPDTSKIARHLENVLTAAKITYNWAGKAALKFTK